MERASHSTSGLACSDAWSRDLADVLSELGVDPQQGLDEHEVPALRAAYGRNQLKAAKRRHILSILIDQFRSVVILLLVVAGVLAFLFSDNAEGIAIFAVIAINAAIGFVTEWRAVRSMEALTRLGLVETVVLREGVMQRIPAEDLVPGDIVMREGGDVVTADMRLLEATMLQADESTLTGESIPVTKSIDTLAARTPVMDQRNMLFKGTAVVRGAGKAVVVGTGLSTELGRISELVTTAEAQQTPLEKRLDTLAQRLVLAVLILALLIAAGGIVAGRDTWLAVEVAIALAVAAIPEGLPIVATIALARGLWRMARHNALIAKLSAVETLGATSVILTDKTGTLTENRMTCTAIQAAGDDVDGLLTIAAQCSNASIHAGVDGKLETVGDPTEVALLIAAAERHIDKDVILERNPELMEIAFDPDTKRMATMHAADSGVLVAVKGAPEAVVPICASILAAEGVAHLSAEERQRWLDNADQLGARGLRTLAIARASVESVESDPYRDLTLLGIVGLEDPAREGVREAIRRCHAAGISVVMVTGDHAATARNIAEAVDIVDADDGSGGSYDGESLDRLLADVDPAALDDARVFSRVSPEQKLDLIDLYQRHDQVVAMTGDGVNDAPALMKADIGVAMGIRGTPVAKEAAAMVLQDDDFGTIVEAVAQGRAIYRNIRKFVVYLMSCNTSEALIVGIATIVGAPLPLLPLQILFLNLVTDVFPALALGVGEGSPLLMKEKPRPFDEPILTRAHWLRIVLHGLVISLTVLGAMAIASFELGFDTERAVTVSFCTLALAQVWHVLNMRDDMRALFLNEITRNPWIWAAMVICVALILGAVYLPLPSELLRLADPGREGWLVIIGMSFVPVVVAPLVRLIAPRRSES